MAEALRAVQTQSTVRIRLDSKGARWYRCSKAGERYAAFVGVEGLRRLAEVRDMASPPRRGGFLSLAELSWQDAAELTSETLVPILMNEGTIAWYRTRRCSLRRAKLVRTVRRNKSAEHTFRFRLQRHFRNPEDYQALLDNFRVAVHAFAEGAMTEYDRMLAKQSQP